MKGGQLARLAGVLCGQRHFQHWLGAESADQAAAIVRDVCGVQSRAHLDHDAQARERFHTFIRRPWVAGQAFKQETTA